MFKIPTLLIVIWLAIGVLAAWQRDYFKSEPQTCAKAGTVTVTTLAGPLNYAGVNPKVGQCHVPQPSQ